MSPPRERAESAELVEQIAALAADKKAEQILELDLRGLISYTDSFLICSGNNERQTKAIADAIAEGLRERLALKPRRTEGQAQGHWILLDYVDVVVHVFTPATRDFYSLESLWGEAPSRRFGPTGEPLADALRA